LQHNKINKAISASQDAQKLLKADRQIQETVRVSIKQVLPADLAAYPDARFQHNIGFQPNAVSQ